MDRWFLRIAVIYALVAMLLGITMGIREDFTQASTHAHLNLVGWVSMALYALVYRQYPAAAQSRFAMLHFWIANVGAVLLTVGIYTQMADMPSLAVYRDLGFFHHDSRHADFHRDRVFESLGSRRRVEAEFSSPFPADFSSPRR